ncbi:hypothetical protein ND748_02910 [Frankia sp. AiPs1]|nr:hypothetical protein [Frankia sp. AiPs1]MCM3920631.1 hypothetical protein [Frankia sp. AiPs1]
MEIMAGVRDVLDHAPLEIGSHERGVGIAERSPRHCHGLIFVVYQQLLEEELVAHAPDLRAALGVDLGAVTHQGQASDECLLDPLVDRFGGSNDSPGRLQLAGDPLLLLTRQVLWNAATHHAPCQPPPLLCQLGDAPSGSVDLRRCPPALAVQLLPDTFPYLILNFLRDAHRGVVALNGRLNLRDRPVPSSAVGPALMPPQAEEVHIFSFGVGDAQPAAASRTKHRPFEVVVVYPLLFARLVVRPQHFLDAGKQLL